MGIAGDGYMHCPKCQSESTAIAGMALARGLHIGHAAGHPMGQINMAVAPLVGPRRPQPSWLFWVVGACAIAIGIYIGSSFHWQIAGFWGIFIGIGSLVIAWPFIFSSYRLKTIKAYDQHQEILRTNWFCLSCGHLWPPA